MCISLAICYYSYPCLRAYSSLVVIIFITIFMNYENALRYLKAIKNRTFSSTTFTPELTKSPYFLQRGKTWLTLWSHKLQNWSHFVPYCAGRPALDTLANDVHWCPLGWYLVYHRRGHVCVGWRPRDDMHHRWWYLTLPRLTTRVSPLGLTDLACPSCLGAMC